ncbi:allantoate deiminase [Metabacillus crassostreae]|uniref:allantoate deiminase n=1 Tax=Metabacillus crassostreae TaxID=929098 RepID=UPI001EF95117|nr:allantoate deiminase [Metabacillus crassostreae]MBM7606550.1 allantoate deiminase [Metabacillus crassostreae]
MDMRAKDTSTLYEQIEQLVDWLAEFGKSENGGVTRLLYSDSWDQAQRAVEKYMNQSGLVTYYDDVGNLYGRLVGSEENTTTILTGSHIDTVKDGGKFDGAYGIIAGLLALRGLYEQYGAPKKNIEVVSLCEEEGSRFPMTYWGSGNISGAKNPEDILNIKDSQGVSFEASMNKLQFGIGKYSLPKRNDLDCFIELHIEQGVVLEKEKKTIGVVSHIVGQRRYNLTVIGESNHAGTTPMAWRKDAMYAAAQLIQSLIDRGKEMFSDLVVTVGQISLEPNIANVIPKKATFSVDIRHSKEDVLERFCDVIFKDLKMIANKHQTQLEIDNWMNENPVLMSEQLNSLIQTILEKKQVPYMKMISGAGHDSQIFGQYCPTALIFVPSQNGISHSPLEFTNTKDLEVGIQVLMEALYELAY